MGSSITWRLERCWFSPSSPHHQDNFEAQLQEKGILADISCQIYSLQKPDPDAMPTIVTPSLPDPENAQEVGCLRRQQASVDDGKGSEPQMLIDMIPMEWSEGYLWSSPGLLISVDIEGAQMLIVIPMDRAKSILGPRPADFTDEYLGIGAWLNLELAMCILCIYAGVSVALGPSVTRLAFGGPSDVQTIIACAGFLYAEGFGCLWWCRIGELH
uniref:Uncharacterized protein n=1 Tax=Oryza meridionalis TaxID=40149 RepID=A0A0E0DGE2_9ORYZ